MGVGCLMSTCQDMITTTTSNSCSNNLTISTKWKTEIVLRSLRPPLHPTMGAAQWIHVTSISLKVQKSELQIHHFLRPLQVGVIPHRSARHQPPCQQFKDLL